MSPRPRRALQRTVAPSLIVVALVGLVLYLVIDATGDGPSPSPRPVAAVALFIDSFSEPLEEDWRVNGPVVAEAGEGSGDRLVLRSPAGALGGSGELVHRLPAAPWALSLDLRLQPRSRARLRIGTEPRTLRVRTAGEAIELQMGPHRHRVSAAAGWPPGPWHHVEIAGSRDLRVSVDGASITFPSVARPTLGIGAEGGPVVVDNLLASSLEDPRSLLLQRLASLHARIPRGSSPLGTGRDGGLRLSEGWTTGFWPGALWQAADLTPESDLFPDWALAATLDNLGDEQSDTHDLGFKYELSSVAAHRRVCQGPVQGQDEYERADDQTCRRLRASGLAAAAKLLRIARSSGRAGTLPTRAAPGCGGCRSDGEADTIIDGAMNLPLLLWAGRATGRDAYRRVAIRAARRIQKLLVRRDGSTLQSVHIRRRDGRVVLRHTHQGRSSRSTWARGQAWAVHGFTRLAEQLDDRRLLRVAERTARYVARHLPRDQVPRYDYDASEGAPRDTTAGVIAAAGLLRLGVVCRRTGDCREPQQWTLLGRRVLRASLRSVETAPLGFFGNGVQTLGGRASWDDDGELIFGLYYALEAIRIADGGAR